MDVLNQLDFSVLPENAQQELYDFFLFLKQRYKNETVIKQVGETALLSEESLAKDWDKAEEEEAWKMFQ